MPGKRGGKGAASERPLEELVDQVKTRQKTEPGFADAWREYCRSNHADKHDPALHDAAFLTKGLSVIGTQQKQTLRAEYPAGKKGAEANGKGAKGAKGAPDAGKGAAKGGRGRGGGKGDEGSPGRGGGGRGGKGRASGLPYDHETLVQMVKTQQRELPGWRDAWWDYVECHGEGSFDPSRYDVPFLREALAILAAPTDGPPAPAGKGGKKGGSPPTPNVPARAAEAPLNEYENHLARSAGAPPPGGPVVASGRHEAQRQRLIEEVKRRQRHMPGFRQYWIEYCHSNGFGGMDPSRHDLEFLRRGLLPPQVNHRELVDTIKAFQRSDAQFKHDWVEYCTSRASGIRDPQKHSPEFLTVALRELAGGRGLRGVPYRPVKAQVPTPGHAELAATIKRMQKTVPGTRERWIDFCGRWGSSDLDPSRHHAEFLAKAVEFLRDGEPAQGGPWPAGEHDVWSMLQRSGHDPSMAQGY